MMPLWNHLRSSLVELVYPKTCAGCGMRGTWVCDHCASQVPRLDSGICFRCGGPAAATCRLCSQMDRSIFLARAAYPYMGWIGNAVQSFKYVNEWSRAAHLATHMLPSIIAMGKPDLLVPVPLHSSRLKERGYNQSQLLAEAIGKEMGIPVAPLLVRSRQTESQVTLSREGRMANVEGAFGIDPRWAPAAGTRYTLIDDVRTTSSTLNACARALQLAGPASICVATLALDVPAAQLQAWLEERRA